MIRVIIDTRGTIAAFPVHWQQRFQYTDSSVNLECRGQWDCAIFSSAIEQPIKIENPEIDTLWLVYTNGVHCQITNTKCVQVSKIKKINSYSFREAWHSITEGHQNACSIPIESNKSFKKEECEIHVHHSYRKENIPFNRNT